jgi:hypothetical protein
MDIDVDPEVIPTLLAKSGSIEIPIWFLFLSNFKGVLLV